MTVRALHTKHIWDIGTSSKISLLEDINNRLESSSRHVLSLCCWQCWPLTWCQTLIWLFLKVQRARKMEVKWMILESRVIHWLVGSHALAWIILNDLFPLLCRLISLLILPLVFSWVQFGFEFIDEGVWLVNLTSEHDANVIWSRSTAPSSNIQRINILFSINNFCDLLLMILMISLKRIFKHIVCCVQTWRDGFGTTILFLYAIVKLLRIKSRLNVHLSAQLRLVLEIQVLIVLTLLLIWKSR